jgi:lycopene cyclase domain-containing protein
MSLYSYILLASFSFPFLLSFDKKLQFYRMWPAILPSLVITGLLFITGDIIFAREGVWGFNPRYHSGIVIAFLPLEEWLFFLIIPYCCLFIHYVYRLYSGDFSLTGKTVRWISAILILLLAVLIAVYHDRVYSVTYFGLALLATAVAMLGRSEVPSTYYISFLIMLIPFFIVNAVLTGTFIDEEVVWYNADEIIGLRLVTVPVEDISYAYSLILINLLLTERFLKIFRTHNRFSK